jgi:diguanylate cyclase (GGDEF)-like protein
MGIRAKITLLLLGILLALAALTVGVLRWEMKRNLVLLEETESRGDQRRLIVALDAQMRQVDALLGSWSNWTELYDYVAKPNPNFRTNELTASALRVAHLDWLILLNQQGQIQDLVEVPQADGSVPVTNLVTNQLSKVANFTSALKNINEGCSVIEADQRLSFICFRPLLNSEGNGPASGTVAIGRWIDQNMIKAVSEQTDLEFELKTIPAREASLNTTVPNYSLFNSSEMSVVRFDDHLKISFPIISLFSRHVGDVTLTWPRRSVAKAQESVVLAQQVIVLLIGAAGLIIILLVDQLVVRRLRRLKRELGDVVQHKHWSGEIHSTGNDEIAELARYATGLMGIVRTQLVELRNLSSTDTLTGLPNRRAFDSRLAHALAQHVRAKQPAALVLLDVDFFKRYNDTYGHPAGDVALQNVAQCLKSVLRRELDLPARLGGEEFGVVLECTQLEGAIACAESIRNALLAAAVPHSGNMPLGIMSISCGVAVTQEGDTPTSIYQRADKGLYVAKESGRNCVSAGN